MYTKECHSRFKLIDFPSEFSDCADHFCADRDHMLVLDTLYFDIVTALSEAARAVAGRGGARLVRRGGSCITGWNKHIAGAHREARSKFNQWVLCGRPNSGPIHKEMCDSRRVFKSRLKWLQNNQDQR